MRKRIKIIINYFKSKLEFVSDLVVLKAKQRIEEDNSNRRMAQWITTKRNQEAMSQMNAWINGESFAATCDITHKRDGK